MLRILLLILIGYFVYQYLKRSRALREKRQDLPKKQTALPAKELVQDPVCKVYLAQEKAIVHEGHFFCSNECREKFKSMQA